MVSIAKSISLNTQEYDKTKNSYLHTVTNLPISHLAHSINIIIVFGQKLSSFRTWKYNRIKYIRKTKKKQKIRASHHTHWRSLVRHDWRYVVANVIYSQPSKVMTSLLWTNHDMDSFKMCSWLPIRNRSRRSMPPTKNHYHCTLRYNNIIYVGVQQFNCQQWIRETGWKYVIVWVCTTHT